MTNPYPAIEAGTRLALDASHRGRAGVMVTVQADSPAGYRWVEALADDGFRNQRIDKTTLVLPDELPSPLGDGSAPEGAASVAPSVPAHDPEAEALVAELRQRAASRVAPATAELLSKAADFIAERHQAP